MAEKNKGLFGNFRRASKTHRTHRRSLQAGDPPGTLIREKEAASPVPITIIRYNSTEMEEYQVSSYEEIPNELSSEEVLWINVDGVRDGNLLSGLGHKFDIHGLILEDIQNTGQRPKIEEGENYLYTSLKMIQWQKDVNILDLEQISIFLREGLVITFQERRGDVFEAVRNRIREKKGRVRLKGADYLYYCLVDELVDYYLITVGELEECYDKVEERMMEGKREGIMESVHELRHQVVTLKRSIWPLREEMLLINKGQYAIISEDTSLFFRDVYDHILQLNDSVDSYRDMLGGIIDYYHSSLSADMNAVMKVLTLIATIFIPLTFLAGIYGMNFQNMPELGWKFGYPAILILMGIVAVIMLIFFKKKKWI